jgi:DNA-binding FrmR family transcriptional regulator
VDEDLKRKVGARLKRIEGQIHALQRMVEADDRCVDLLVQISAAQGALGAVGQVVLGNHIQSCVSEAFEHGSDHDRGKAVQELMDVFGRYSGICRTLPQGSRG